MNNPMEIFFNLFVVAAFASSALDHWFIGRGIIVVPLRCFLLGCFLFTEGYLAVTAQPAMWLYVILNLWGLVNIYAHRNAPLRTKR